MPGKKHRIKRGERSAMDQCGGNQPELSVLDEGIFEAIKAFF